MALKRKKLILNEFEYDALTAAQCQIDDDILTSNLEAESREYFEKVSAGLKHLVSRCLWVADAHHKKGE